MEKRSEHFFCSGCARTITAGEELEIETACRLKNCSHIDPEVCATTTVYSHKDADCFETASVKARGKQ